MDRFGLLLLFSMLWRQTNSLFEHNYIAKQNPVVGSLILHN